MAWFRRDRDRNEDEESMDPQVLLARAHDTDPDVSLLKPPAGFALTVADVFSITGRGTVVTGRVESGSVRKGATVRLTRADGSTRDIEVTGIEMFRKIVDTATAGDNVGLLLKGIARTDIAPGDVLRA